MAALEQGPTAYEILGVHPSAPAELIGAAYWRMTSDLRAERASSSEGDAALHRLTRAYELVSDPVRRAGYNLAIAHTGEPLTKRSLPRRKSFLQRVFRRNGAALDWSVDPHEVLGLDPRAPQASVPIAYQIMHDAYLRLPPGSRRRRILLDLLDKSYAVLADPEMRAHLPGAGSAERRESSPTAPAPTDFPADDLPAPSRPDVAQAKASPPATVRPAAEPPRPPVVAPPPAADPLRAARSGREGGGEARRGVVTKRAIAVARGVRWVAVTIAAAAVVAAGAVATGVHWAALAVAALAVIVARYIRSGWLAMREWLGGQAGERPATKARRSGDADEAPATADEVFLGRLASKVGDSERGRSSDKPKPR